MEPCAYFISDAHLGITPPGGISDREEKLIHLLNSLQGSASHVFIVGDLFEFWFEYQDYVSKNHMELFRSLAALAESGTEVHLFRGNHDFAYGDFFPKNLGVQVHTDLLIEVQGKKVYLRHGDGVAKSDWSYRIFRKVLDFPLNRFLFRWVHPDLGMKLARFVGRNSRKIGESKKIRLDEYMSWGKSVLKRKQCDYCIHGHHHIPGIWKTEQGTIASPGEWIRQLHYLKMGNGELELVKVQ